MFDAELRAIISDFVQNEINRAMASRQLGIRPATISSYDPEGHRIKVKLQPDDIETGWFPHSVPHIGNGVGIITGPSIGDQVMVGFLDGDPETPVNLGRVHSDKERPPVAQSGEVIIQTGQMMIKMDKDGNFTISGSNGLSMNVPNMNLTGTVTIG